MLTYRSRANHQLQHTFCPIKQGSRILNQIMRFTMTLVLFTDPLYSCRMSRQLCAAEYVLQNGQREANSPHVVDFVWKVGEHFVGYWSVPETWILEEEYGSRLHVALTQDPSQLAPPFVGLQKPRKTRYLGHLSVGWFELFTNSALLPCPFQIITLDFTHVIIHFFKSGLRIWILSSSAFS